MIAAGIRNRGSEIGRHAAVWLWVALLAAPAASQDDRDDDPVRLTGDAERAYRLAHWERAEQLIREAIRKEDSARNRQALCGTLFRARRWDDCMRECEVLAGWKDPAERPGALAMKGAAAWRKGDAAGARTWCAQAIEVADAKAPNAYPAARRSVRATLAFLEWKSHESRRFVVRTPPEARVDVAALAARLDAAYDACAAALDASVDGRIDAFVFTDQRQADEILGVPLSYAVPRERVVYVLPDAPVGHLVAHVVSFYAASAKGKERPRSVFLNEGLACALSGDALWERRMKEIPAEFHRTGKLAPLATLLKGEGVAADFVAPAGSFVRWLISVGGRENFLRLWREYNDHADPAGAAKPEAIDAAAPWRAVYGRTIDELDAAWRATLR